MNILRISLFGKFSVRDERLNLVPLEAHKLQELLSYLLLHRDRPHHRERLANLFWAANSTIKKKKYLRQALWQLHSCLDSDQRPDDNLLIMDTEWVRLNPDAAFQVDVVDFEAAYMLVQEVPGEMMDEATVQVVKAATSLYKGDLLEGWYQDWCLFHRERLQRMYLSMLHKLMCYCEAHQEYQTGINYGQIVLQYDRAQERTHQQLMRLYYLSGDRSLALRQYKTCITMLDEELGVEPSRQTEMLHHQIQDDQLDPVGKVEVEKVISATTLWRLLDAIKQIRSELDLMNQQLEEHVEKIVTTSD